MAEAPLPQDEADRLLAMEKRRTSDSPIMFPKPRRRSSAELRSVDGRETFALDMYFGDIDFPRFVIQIRARHDTALARLELDGPVHLNPDGELVPTPHLHLYREGDGVRWAYPAPADQFSDLSDRWLVWGDFMRFCNITAPPELQGEIFS